ncbi:MAG: hypothetical protein EBS12_06050, partial [Flavobacteriia bacterium]|nr:hypothetical protein [Flavobacteriia bacterium]
MNLIADFSFFWLIPITFISLGLTFLIYQNKNWVKELKSKQRFILRALRFSSLFLILFLLLGIILQATNYREEKPVFISLIDNSSSMMNYKDSSVIKNQITRFKKELADQFKD